MKKIWYIVNDVNKFCDLVFQHKICFTQFAPRVKFLIGIFNFLIIRNIKVKIYQWFPLGVISYE